MIRLVFVFQVMLLVVGAPAGACPGVGHQLEETVTRRTATDYFPRSVFRDLTFDTEYVAIFANALAAANEPILHSRKNLTFAVRIGWVSSFDGEAFLMFERLRNGESFVSYRRLRPQTQRSRNRASVTRRRLDETEFTAVRALLRRTNFFLLTNKQDVIATDGTAWVIEVFDNKKYHAIYRAEPRPGPVRDIGEQLARIAGVNVDLIK